MRSTSFPGHSIPCNLEIQNQISEIDTERAKLAAVLKKMNDGVIIVDGKGIVQLINPAAENMYYL